MFTQEKTLTKKSMWKKLFTVLTICSVFATSGVSVLASSVNEDLVTNVSVSPEVFNPTAGEHATFEFDLSDDSTVTSYVYVTGVGAAFLAHNQEESAGLVSYAFYGTEGNDPSASPLPDGTYQIKLNALSLDETKRDDELLYVTIQNEATEVAPTISALSISPSVFSTDDGETATIGFSVDQESFVQVRIVTPYAKGHMVVRSFTDYDGETLLDNTNLHSFIYDGLDYLGNPLEDGDYKVWVNVTNDNGTDFEYVEFEVDNSDLPPDPNPTDEPDVTNLDVTPSPFTPEDGETTEITFDVDEDADLTVVVKDGSTVVKEFSAYDYDHYADASHTIEWNGTDDDGYYLDEGYYLVLVTAENSDGDDSAYTYVYVDEDTTVVDPDLVENFDLNPSNTWDPSDEDELEISFDLTDDVDNLTITAEKDGEEIEIFDDEDLDEDDYEEFWDGEDEDGYLVDAGVWTIIIEADGQEFSKTIEIEYETPEIVEAFVTKDSFDNEEGEFTTLVFQVDSDAVVTVQVYDGTHKELTLVDEEDVNGDDWYWISWDGTDEDGDEVDYDEDWKFKITAESLVDDDIKDVVYVEFKIEEDYAYSKKSNVTNDYNAPVVFDEDKDDSIEFYFCMEEDAEVYLAVYDGEYASGSAEVELLDYVDLDEGCHTVTWNGLDDDGDELDEGIYSYKLITKDGTYKETEIGRFVIGDAASSGGGGGDDDDDDDDDVEGTCSYYYWDLGYLDAGNELCEAIAWVTEEGIFHGYPDGSFGAYKNINRAEVLKVVLKAFDAPLIPANGSDFGFWDVDPSAWYMTYVRTGKFYGMVDGYPDGSLKLADNINRVEMLKLMLEASDKFTSYELATGMYETLYADVQPQNAEALWFYDYATAAYEYDLYNTEIVNGQEYLRPAQLVERGEVALLLYRMQKAGLLDR